MNEVIMAFSIGLLSAPHCVAMCGSLCSAFVLSSRPPSDVVPLRLVEGAQTSVAARPSGLRQAWILGSGKLMAYTALGALAGSGGGLALWLGAWPGTLMRALSACLLIAIGLYIGRWWGGIGWLEARGARAWQALLPLASPRTARVARSPMVAGVLWGLLPCGLVYSMLAMALSSGTAARGATLMASFGLGTLPFVLGTGGLIHGMRQVVAAPRFRHLAGGAMILMGLISLFALSSALTPSGMPAHVH